MYGYAGTELTGLKLPPKRAPYGCQERDLTVLLRCIGRDEFLEKAVIPEGGRSAFGI